MLISPHYLELQKELYDRTGDYGRSGDKWLSRAIQLCDGYATSSILDYGCGRGQLVYALQMANYDANGYDPAMDMYSKQPSSADVVMCTDVMEHIEPECLTEVISHIHSLTRKVLFLVVSLRPAGKRLKDGRNAHLIVQGAWWWSLKFNPLFEIKQAIANQNQEWIAELIPKENDPWMIQTTVR